MHFAVFTPPVSGHLHPFGALGRELIRRGHRVTVFHMPDLADRVIAEGLEFVPIGAVDHPPGSLPVSLKTLAGLDGLDAVRFTINAVRKSSEMTLRDAPSAIRAAKIDALLVDQMEPAGGAVAEYLGLPFVTICNALLLNEEPGAPPPFTPWNWSCSRWARLRNRIGYAAGRRTTKPISDVVARYRQLWKLSKLRTPSDSFSRLAQISQQPPAFDFPRKQLPSAFHYVGPLRGAAHKAVSFPWEKLDGRPLVYASLGTLQNRRAGLFRTFAEACSDLNVQLVLTHGGGLEPSAMADFPGNPLVVSYAPQREVLAKASLTLTHAGLNTVLDSFSFGVPVVALPITYEQPAIASRVRWSGAGESLPLSRATVKGLRSVIERVLSAPEYRRRATQICNSIVAAGGTPRAADIVEAVL